MRLVDADYFSAEMKKRQDKCAEWVETVKEEDDETYQHACGALSVFSEVKLTLDKMQTVDIVQCKDCEYFRPIDQFFGECLHLPNELVIDINWYCADGERRETDEAD